VALAGDGRAVRERATYLPGELHVYGELDARAHLAWCVRGRERARWRARARSRRASSSRWTPRCAASATA
jgi:hypothetical protein